MPVLSWAGSGIRVRFEGTSFQITLSDLEGESYFTAVIDNDWEHAIVIPCRAGRHTYNVAEKLPEGSHTLELIRRTDPTFSQTGTTGRLTGTGLLELRLNQGGRLLEAPERPALRIAFFGDSITSGHGVLAENSWSEQDRATWDVTRSYAGIIAQTLKAEAHYLSISGIGLIKSWYPLTMPDVFNRINPGSASSQWDNSNWQPDLLVINIFQNDAWLMPEHDGVVVVESYIEFVRSLRMQYPKATIICALGNMDATQPGSPWPGYVRRAVERMKAEPYLDDGIHAVIFPYKNTPGHPKIKEQQIMADQLLNFISEQGLLDDGMHGRTTPG
jgi:hypothetical protein